MNKRFRMLAVVAAFTAAGIAPSAAQDGFGEAAQRALDYHGQYPVVPLAIEGAFSLSQSVEGDDVSVSIECGFDFAFSDADGQLVTSNLRPENGQGAAVCSGMSAMVTKTQSVLFPRESLADMLNAVPIENWTEVDSADGTVTYEAEVADIMQSNGGFTPPPDLQNIEGFDGKFYLQMIFDTADGYVKSFRFLAKSLMEIEADYTLLDSGRPALQQLTFFLDVTDTRSGTKVGLNMELEVTTITELESVDVASALPGDAPLFETVISTLMKQAETSKPRMKAFLTGVAVPVLDMGFKAPMWGKGASSDQ